MSQVALNYRNSSLSEYHTHGGALRAGYRVPDMNVRLRSRIRVGWRQPFCPRSTRRTSHSWLRGSGREDTASEPNSISAREPFPGDCSRSEGRGAV